MYGDMDFEDFSETRESLLEELDKFEVDPDEDEFLYDLLTYLSKRIKTDKHLKRIYHLSTNGNLLIKKKNRKRLLRMLCKRVD